MCVLTSSVVSDFCDPINCSPPGSSVHGGSPGKDMGLGCHFLLQWIFLTQESNPRAPLTLVLSPLLPLNFVSELQIQFLFR